jgi:hypothetical protein
MVSERYILHVPEQVNGTTGFNEVHKSCQAQSANHVIELELGCHVHDAECDARRGKRISE